MYWKLINELLVSNFNNEFKKKKPKRIVKLVDVNLVINLINLDEFLDFFFFGN